MNATTQKNFVAILGVLTGWAGNMAIKVAKTTTESIPYYVVVIALVAVTILFIHIKPRG